MPAPSPAFPGPSEARVIRTLKNGYWDRTEVIELADGSQRVRKQTKGASAPGPWAVRSLRREIRYLSVLPESARGSFPQMLNAWDRELDGVPDVGYEMPFFSTHCDAGELARNGVLDQPEIDLFQDVLADAVITRLHVAEKPDELLSGHLVGVIDQSLDVLRADPLLAPLIDAERIQLNDTDCLGPRAAFEKILQETDALPALDAEPSVRLHGDFFLENILWRAERVRGEGPRLLLIDPVSVAGVFAGPPVFDLVKYESYAKGELPGLRSAWVDVEGFERPAEGRYSYRIRWQETGLQAFQNRDWRARFRCAFETKFGSVNERMYRLIDGYFSVAMAVNTNGVQRCARLLKATSDFNAVVKGV